MGFTKRRAAGRFTCDEAAASIDRLQGNEVEVAPRAVAPAARLSAQEQLLRVLRLKDMGVATSRRVKIAQNQGTFRFREPAGDG